jgi:hypothetical protein
MEEKGFAGAPLVAGSGFTPDGFECLEYVEGEQVGPEGLSAEGGSHSENYCARLTGC